MILHNRKTGQTCWFQNNSTTADGNHVPVPHLTIPPSGVPKATDFWLPPSQTAAIQCAQCHDNGPWMNSNWLYSQFKELKDRKGNYTTVPYGKFADWPKTNDFVEVGEDGIEGDFPKCTECHKLAAAKSEGKSWPTPGLLESGTNGTYQRWFSYSTGQELIPHSTATEHDPVLLDTAGGATYITNDTRDYDYTHWMPPKENAPRPLGPIEYAAAYGKHLKELKTCMQTLQADRKPPCRTMKTAMLNSSPAPAGTGALVSASVIQTGQSYTAAAAPLNSTSPPAPQILAAGQSIRLGWQADATFDVCSITASLPAGVMVPATTPTGSTLIGSGDNWQLPETPPVIGPLTEPGIYDFSIDCRDTYTASLRFQVGTTGPRSLVKLVTSVNHTVQATAIHSNSSIEPSTTTNVQTTDSVELTWLAYNVRAGSCILSGPGATSTAEAGSKVITGPALADQTFTFECTGANDGVLRRVSATLHPVSSSSCSYSIAPATASVPAAGGTGSTSVTAPAGCSWSTGGNPAWITINSGSSGNGNGTLAYSVQANNGSTRTAILTIAGQTFTITQAALVTSPLSATLSASTPPLIKPQSVVPLAGLTITIAGGTSGQRIFSNVAVNLSVPLANVPDTAQLTDASGAVVAAVKAANTYTFFNVQFEEPGAGGTRVYTITNMKANTASIPAPATGTVPITAMVAISGGAPIPLSNPSQTIALLSPNLAPTADSVTPNSGAGPSQVFRLAYSDPNGYRDLASVSVVFRSNDRHPKECRVKYDLAHNSLYLASDAGPVRGPVTPASVGTLQNSRCSLNAASSSAAGAGNTLTLNLALTFRPSLIGQTTVLMEASDGTLSSGLQPRGTWTVAIQR